MALCSVASGSPTKPAGAKMVLSRLLKFLMVASRGSPWLPAPKVL